jgi:hypothetical protein
MSSPLDSEDASVQSIAAAIVNYSPARTIELTAWNPNSVALLLAVSRLTKRVSILEAACKHTTINAVTVSGTSLADVITVPVAAGDLWRFDASITVAQTSANGIVGFGIGFTGTGAISAESWIAQTTAIAAFRSVNAFSTAMVDASARLSGTTLPARVFAIVSATTAGNISFMAQRSAGVTKLTGSFMLTSML